MFRKRMSRGKSRRLFKRSRKTRALNVRAVSRGGYRL